MHGVALEQVRRHRRCCRADQRDPAPAARAPRSARRPALRACLPDRPARRDGDNAHHVARGRRGLERDEDARGGREDGGGDELGGRGGRGRGGLVGRGRGRGGLVGRARRGGRGRRGRRRRTSRGRALRGTCSRGKRESGTRVSTVPRLAAEVVSTHRERDAPAEVGLPTAGFVAVSSPLPFPTAPPDPPVVDGAALALGAALPANDSMLTSATWV